MRLETGQIGSDEFDKREKELLDRLDRLEGAGADEPENAPDDGEPGPADGGGGSP